MKLILNFTRTCVKCGCEYVPSSLAQKFCSRCSGSIKRRVKHDVLTQERKCLECGKPFLPRKMDNNFCCKACSDRYRRGHAKVEKTCPSCGKTFVTASTIKRFCSRTCQSKMHGIKRKAPMRICKMCGKLIVGRRTNASWCLDCLAVASAPVPPEQRVCIICGATFTGRGNKRCCSPECARVRHCMTTTNYRHAVAEKKRQAEESARMAEMEAFEPDYKAFAAADESDMVYGNMVYF